MIELYTRNDKIYLKEEIEKDVRQEVLDTETYLDTLANKDYREIWAMLTAGNKIKLIDETIEDCLASYSHRVIEDEISWR